MTHCIGDETGVGVKDVFLLLFSILNYFIFLYAGYNKFSLSYVP